MDTPPEWAGPDGYVVSSDPGRLDIERIHRFLTAAYWSAGIPRDVVSVRSRIRCPSASMRAPVGRRGSRGW